MACFSIFLHTFAYICAKKPSCHDNQYFTSPHQKTANENRWGAHAVLLWLHAGWGVVFSHQGLSGNVRVVLNQANFVSEADAEKVATEVEQKVAEERKKRKVKQ